MRRGKKGEKEKRIFDVLYFVGVLTVFAVLLNYLMAVRPDMAFEQRVVAYHTASLLNAFSGKQVTVYEWSVEAGDRFSSELKNTLLTLGFEEVQTARGTEFRKQGLSPDDERIADLFLEQRMSLGEDISVSKANIMLASGFKVEIIPECVGWVGFFAVAALIVAYPRAPWRKKIIGLFISLPLMYAVNILRLAVSIASIDESNLAVFEFTHGVLWQFLLVGWALCLWLVWIYFIVEEREIRGLRKRFNKRAKKLTGRP